MKNNSTKYHYIFSFFLLIGLTSCEDILEVDLPSNQLASNTVYATDVTAEAAVNGIYKSMVTDVYYNNLHSTLGQTSDELILNSLAPNVYTSNEIQVIDGTINSMWGSLYKVIYNANTVIEGINESTTLTPSYSKKWIAEAKFIRGLSYFYLTNLWGDVPLVLSTDVNKTALAPRNAQAEVYAQIIADLTDASNDLPTDYTDYKAQRIRAPKWAAEAMLARVNLYLGKYTEAITHADAVINQSGTYKMITGLSAANSPFIANNNEAILQIPYFNTVYTYEGGAVFTTNAPFLLRKSATLFETGDARKTNWTLNFAVSGVTYLAPRKYKNSYTTTPSERSTILRLAEVYLIRAEARAMTDNYTGARDDVNVIRDRALVPLATTVDKNELLDLIALERQRELFAEFGHRWLDLKRTGKADAVLGALSDKVWASTDALYPIPETARLANPFLTQNLGYN
ncbi:RagB/SusD family nutrient uptake outer membrane protein [Flavobacterium hungaricum]|uniref:RagB/SusD family nutrient uptake outer membrane protein n=1 Tax=Flavobacterium hungaricum TaxID=2082725 RepID=A0ABR9TNE0_9FLAO|nr:RagB/SusD family nutrient uptake outer membrane protein [Flavobacterium hungaricum]MBE8726871.1 RagB/SusD family nutrient uptake outer membrane protein [Flavobacterium hungaricum]